MKNKFPYEVILYSSEEEKNSLKFSLKGSESFDSLPDEEKIKERMIVHNSRYCEVWYDVRDNEGYDVHVATYMR